MNVLQLPTHPTLFTHHEAPYYSPIPPTMSQRKRKAEDEDENMGSPNGSPAPAHRNIARPAKKSRGNIVSGHPLTLPRLLETLDAQSLRSVLQSICERHPEIGLEVVASAPRPSVSATLGVLSQYQDKLREAFPFGGNPRSDYAYNRVKQALEKLIDALTSFTPHYLPPNETQATTSFTYLDSATQVIHDLPNWDSHANNHFKYTAYEDITKAWTLVIQEASKRGGGFQVKTGGWDQRLKEHNVQSGGRMQGAVNALTSLGWMSGSQGMDDPGSIRNQLLSGTYGTGQSVGVGSW